MALGSAGSGSLALPMLVDGMNFDWPQYYETIQTASRLTCHTVQSADLDGDGQDELICRGPAGINAYSYDPVTGQRDTSPPGPAWRRRRLGAECYYATISAADLNGDGRAELFGHGPNGTEVWSYDPTTGVWSEVPRFRPAGRRLLGRCRDLHHPSAADLDGDGSAELLARGTTGIVAWKLTAIGFVASPDGPGWSDAASWNPLGATHGHHSVRRRGRRRQCRAGRP